MRSFRCRRFARLATLALGLAAISLADGAEDGQAAPRLEAQRLDGSHYSLADSRGAVTVLVVWSPDSLASRKSLGELQRFAAAFEPRGVTTLAVSTVPDIEALRRFATERQLSLPLAILENSSLGPFPERTLPQILIFDRDGLLHSLHRGLFRLRDLEQAVEPLLQAGDA